MTKIIWGINIPYLSQKIDRAATDEKCRNAPRDGRGVLPIFVPYIRIHKEMFFVLCDICGSQVPPGRVSRGITTCCPKCNAKKWDARNGLVIERERKACGIRPLSFWETIKRECFVRDGWKCRGCGITRDEVIKRGVCNVLECHHIKRIKDGGNNELSNLITLCHTCHRAEHSHEKNVARKHHPLITE